MCKFVIANVINIFVMGVFNIAFFKIEFKWLCVFFMISAMLHAFLLMKGYIKYIDMYLFPYFVSISLMSVYKTFFAPITDVRAISASAALVGNLIFRKVQQKHSNVT